MDPRLVSDLDSAYLTRIESRRRSVGANAFLLVGVSLALGIFILLGGRDMQQANRHQKHRLDREEAANRWQAKSLQVAAGKVAHFADGVQAETRHLDHEKTALGLEREWIQEERDLETELHRALEAQSGALEELTRVLEQPHSNHHQKRHDVDQARLAVEAAKKAVTKIQSRIDQEHRLQPFETIAKTETEAEALVDADKDALGQGHRLREMVQNIVPG